MRAHIVIPDELIKKVDEVVGPRRRSAFMVEAIEAKLQRERVLKAVKATLHLPPPKAIPEWNTPESASQWVHDQRVEADRIRSKRFRRKV
ncbi:MAG: hypothetical protein ACREHC_05135 [Candidatus Levyibacteriota bacterium]